MPVFLAPDFFDHEQVVFCSDPESNLKAIIAIHNTNRGPALGGCRMWPYVNEQEAINDVLRLSRGMTYKAALAKLPYGGGKSVIIGNAKTDKSPELFKAMGRFVEKLCGNYIVAEDVGTTVDDMETILTQTKSVVGTRTGGSDNPAPYTALGVYMGIKAAVEHRLHKKSLSDITVSVQGLGSVGYQLCQHLHKEGARIIASDIDPVLCEKVRKEFAAEIVPVDQILEIKSDVFAPCALGAILNDQTIDKLKSGIVAGAANNQLAHDGDGQVLSKKGVLYAPDYVINAGGLINVSHERLGYDAKKAEAHVVEIYDTLLEIFAQSDREKIPTNVAADRIAENRFKSKKA